MAEISAGQEFEEVLHLQPPETLTGSAWIKHASINFIAGCIGGAAGTFVGHPFDTVKVRIQTQGAKKLYTGALDCVTKTINSEGVNGVYKGLTAPLLGLTGINAIIFGVHGSAVKYMQPGLRTEVLAGMMAGAAQMVIIIPIELAKTRLQIQGQGQRLKKDRKVYTGPLDCLKKIYKMEGIRGCYRGTLAGILRDIPGFGVYFGTYFALTHAFLPKGKTINDIGPIELMLAGGLTGMISWTYSYPADMIKSKIQAEGLAPVGKYKSYADCIRQSIKAEGYGVFTRGLSVCVVRAFPVNAATFAGVEVALRLMGEHRKP